MWLLLSLAVLSMAGSSSLSLLGLFLAVLVDFGAGDTGGSGRGSRTPFCWLSSEALDALEMGSKFIN